MAKFANTGVEVGLLSLLQHHFFQNQFLVDKYNLYGYMYQDLLNAFCSVVMRDWVAIWSLVRWNTRFLLWSLLGVAEVVAEGG